MNQSIKFRIKNQDDPFYHELKQKVSAYLHTQANGRYANSTILLKAVLFLPFYWGAYLSLYSAASTPVLLALYASMGISGLFIAFNLSHDAAHGSLFATPWLNKLVYYATFNPLGTDAYLWKMRHNLSHHAFPNVDGVDADIDNNFLVRLSPNRPLLPHHRWQHIYAPFLYGFFTLIWVFVKDWHYLTRKNLANLRDIKHPWGEVLGVIFAKLFHLFYLIVLPIWWGIEWQTALLGYILFHVTMSYFFLFTNIMNHHSEEAEFPTRDAEGYLPGSWAQHQIATCLDFHPTSRAWSFFFGGFNAHCAHHLFPLVCHVHYPYISKSIQELCKKYGLDYKQSSWWESLGSHFRHMKKLGSTPPLVTIS